VTIGKENERNRAKRKKEEINDRTFKKTKLGRRKRKIIWKTIVLQYLLRNQFKYYTSNDSCYTYCILYIIALAVTVSYKFWVVLIPRVKLSAVDATSTSTGRNRGGIWSRYCWTQPWSPGRCRFEDSDDLIVPRIKDIEPRNGRLFFSGIRIYCHGVDNNSIIKLCLNILFHLCYNTASSTCRPRGASWCIRFFSLFSLLNFVFVFSSLFSSAIFPRFVSSNFILFFIQGSRFPGFVQ
jgi:hypothetical protein